MYITRKKKILTISLCLIFLAISFIIGKAMADAEGAPLAAGEISSDFSLKNTISEIRNNKQDTFAAIGDILPFFESQMIQFLLILIFGFTPFDTVMNCSLFTFRGICLGYTTGMILSSENTTVKTICFVLSYFMVTLVMLIFISNLSEMAGITSKTESISEKFKCIGTTVILFLMTGGASLLIRMIPLVVGAGT